MKTNIALVMFGFVALSTAAEYSSRLRTNPAKTYAEQVEEVEEPVQYRAAVKSVVKAPIRVANVDSYNTHSGYEEDEAVAQEQNKNAHYSFGSAIDDGIMDHSHVRQETRDGLKVEGSYAYSDGFFKRIVNYVADENGYRVVSESVEPISETGPKIDLVNGKAEVHTQIDGVDNSYSVSAQDLHHRKITKEE